MQTIDLNGAAVGTDVTINLPVGGTLVIWFNGECSVDALTDTKYLDINVLVDGVPAAPSNSENAFCTGTGDGALEHWVSAGTNVMRQVGPGLHTIRVQGVLVGFAAGDQWRVDDTSLIVLRQ